MKHFLLLILSVSALSSCSLFEKKVALLWTDHAEIAAYVEVFNSIQDEYKIELHYKANPAEALTRETVHPDIAIGSGFTANQVIHLFSDLENLLEEELILRDEFYPPLIALGKREQEQLLLPISFNLPVLMFKSGLIPENIQHFTLSWEEIEKRSIDFNAESKPRRWIMGFSPRWSSDFMYVYSIINGASFSETFTGQLVWNNQKLEESIRKYRTWSTRVNGNLEDEKRFMEKYFFDPPYKLLGTERILFSYTNLVDFMAIQKEKRADLEFHYIGEENRIPVLEDIVFAGIPKKAKNRNAAEAFITWFFQPETQLLCMETARFKRMRTFGIAEGFSSFPSVNEQNFPQFYPELGGHIPPPEFLKFPEPLPLEWNTIKNEVLKPYLAREAGHTGAIGSLDTLLQKWMRQQTN